MCYETEILQISVFAETCDPQMGAATSAGACGSWLHRQVPLQRDWDAQGAFQPAIDTMTTLADDFNPTQHLGMYYWIYYYTLKTTFSFTPLSLTPSNA